MNRFLDPIGRRDTLLKIKVPMVVDKNLDEISPKMVCSQASEAVDCLAECFWLGLVVEAKPRLIHLAAWMEARQPPALSNWQPDRQRNALNWHSYWWSSLGLAKWLLGSPSSEADLGRALDVEWRGWQLPCSPDVADGEQWARQDHLHTRLAQSLAANDPAFGLRFFEAVRLRKPLGAEGLPLEFGRWACEHLAEGGTRDERFVERGAEMLKKSLPEFYLTIPNWIDSALWLKAIFFDSGVTKTAEETMLRAYDCMPGVPRPDFAR